MLTFEEVIHPLTVDHFFSEYKDKKILILKNKPIIHHFSWIEFEQYIQSIDLNSYDRCPQLQVVLDNGKKYCKRKSNNHLKKMELYKLWKQGHTFILTISENLNKILWYQCKNFEKFYGRGSANLYCSYKKTSKVFNKHQDSTDNFLFHVIGKVEWFIYEKNDLIDNFILSPGNILYIPKHMHHKTNPLSSRITISYHFNEKNINQKTREKWLDWIPKNT